MNADRPYDHEDDATFDTIPPDHGGVLGKVVQHPLDRIEVLPVGAAPDRVKAVCSEVDGLCPVTNQPDHYVVTIEYAVVGKYVIESKSLKLYLWQFRDVGISCEELSATIATELHDQYVEHVGRDTVFTVTAVQQSRGGIALEATTRRGKNALEVMVTGAAVDPGTMRPPTLGDKGPRHY